jgi:predicted DNA-binding protein (UPF0251 family)
MTPAQFDALARLMRLRQSATADGLRLVLVEGMTQNAAASESGASQQAIARAVSSARRYVEDAGVLAGATMPPRRGERG